MKGCIWIMMGLVIASYSYGGLTGKIQGRVTDKETGEPLPFVNVLIEGTMMGAATNIEGEYFIINVPVGTYTLFTRMMGYVGLRIENVRVSAGITTRIDIPLEPTVIEREAILVTAERPIVETDVTSSVRIVSGDDIERMPVSGFEDIVASQMGAVETGAALSGGLHIRGGRSGEVVYVVDGINVNDPVTGRAGMHLSLSAIEEMQVVTGGFNAEHGEAMSGIVKISTRDGGPRPEGGIRLTTDRGLKIGDRDYQFGYDNIDLTLGGPVPLLRNVRFFASANYVDSDGRLPQSHSERRSVTGKLSYTPFPWLKLRLSGDHTAREFTTYRHAMSRGDWLRERPLFHTGNSRLNMSLTHTVSENTFYNITAGFFNTYTEYSSQHGKHFNEWEVITRVLPWVRASINAGWYDPEYREWTDGMTADSAWKLFYSGQIGGGPTFMILDEATGEWVWTGDDLATRLRRERDALNSRVHSVNTWQFVVDENGDTVDIYYHYFDLDQYLVDIRRYLDGEIGEHEMEPSGNMFMIRYHRDRWRRFWYHFRPQWHARNTDHFEVNFALTSQVNRHNQVKFGGFIRQYDLKLTHLLFVNPNPYADHYHKRPRSGAVFVQNKIEFEDLTVNPGIRVDYFDPASKFFINIENPAEGRDWAPPKIQVSPRFGISFAVTDKSLLYANYGHFFQTIDMADMYQNLSGDLTAGFIILGNPNIPAQRTQAYEVGFRHALGPDMRLDITGYLKDVDNLLATREVSTRVGDKHYRYTVYKPEDYAIVKGFELGLTKRAGRFLSGSIGYGFIDAKGTGSSPDEFYFRFRGTDMQPPRREYPLEFDVTHTFRVNANLFLPRGFGPRIFGFQPFSNLNANLQYNLSSGPPYTPTGVRGPGEVGSKRLPSTSTANLRVDRMFSVGRFDWSLFLDVRNLFDAVNVVNVYAATGLPDDNGARPVWDAAFYTARYEEDGYASPEEMFQCNLDNWREFVNTPRNFGSPRIVRAGISFDF